MLVRVILCSALLGAGLTRAEATNIAPPMLDISRQCDASSRHNVSAMSECVVAESEARAELLQNWAKYSNADAERCVKAGRKAKRMPYGVMAQCLASSTAPASKPAAVETKK